jgi:hypothetical protein
MKSTAFHTLVALATLAVTCSAIAGPKTYQVTGPVLAVTDTSVTVQKGDDKWELARDGTTKITGELKVGAKVTIEYTMNAVGVEVKDGAAKPAGDGKKKGKK